LGEEREAGFAAGVETFGQWQVRAEHKKAEG
jgi:hypothetical protein